MVFKKDYDVSIPSAFYAEYREGARVMKIDVDFRESIPLVSYRAIAHWEPPHDAEPISDAQRRQILDNVIFYLHQVRHFKFEVEGGSIVKSQTYGA